MSGYTVCYIPIRTITIAENDNAVIAITGILSGDGPAIWGANPSQFCPIRSIGHAHCVNLVSSCLKNNSSTISLLHCKIVYDDF